MSRGVSQHGRETLFGTPDEGWAVCFCLYVKQSTQPCQSLIKLLDRLKQRKGLNGLSPRLVPGHLAPFCGEGGFFATPTCVHFSCLI